MRFFVYIPRIDILQEQLAASVNITAGIIE